MSDPVGFPAESRFWQDSQMFQPAEALALASTKPAGAKDEAMRPSQ